MRNKYSPDTPLGWGKQYWKQERWRKLPCHVLSAKRITVFRNGGVVFSGWVASGEIEEKKEFRGKGKGRLTGRI